jgi:hypothetical protein
MDGRVASEVLAGLSTCQEISAFSSVMLPWATQFQNVSQKSKYIDVFH